MDRRALVVGVIAPVILAAVAVATPAYAQDDCLVVKEKVFTISVSDEAVANPDCVKVKTGNTTLIWQAGPNVKTLKVAFKAPTLCKGADSSTKPPVDPTCSGNKCTLDKAKQSMTGTFCYSVVVIRQNGTVKTVDPRLIINQ
ncbi:MAG: hypothetical protein U0529_15970 [Thermoanaerobaculia bacterium]